MYFSNYKETYKGNGGTHYEFKQSDVAWLGRIMINYRFGPFN